VIDIDITATTLKLAENRDRSRNSIVIKKQSTTTVMLDPKKNRGNAQNSQVVKKFERDYIKGVLGPLKESSSKQQS